MERSDFGIHFANCEKLVTKQESSKIFSIKFQFLELSNKNNLYYVILVIFDNVDICFYTVDVMLHVSRPFQLSDFNHI